MKKKYNKFLIVSTVFLFIGGVYLYSSNDLISGDIVPVAFGSSLESSVLAESALVSSPVMAEEVNSDISFLATLVSLKNIKMDTSIFNLDTFKALKNNAVQIELVPSKPGRVNPFAPITVTESVGVSAAPVVATNQPTEVTDKTAIFNGTVNTDSVVTDTYFEYGISAQGVNNKIEIAKLSLVGNFVKNIVGLTPQTTYFYKACARINNIASCGDVVSFTTK